MQWLIAASYEAGDALCIALKHSTFIIYSRPLSVYVGFAALSLLKLLFVLLPTGRESPRVHILKRGAPKACPRPKPLAETLETLIFYLRSRLLLHLWRSLSLCPGHFFFLAYFSPLINHFPSISSFFLFSTSSCHSCFEISVFLALYQLIQ